MVRRPREAAAVVAADLSGRSGAVPVVPFGDAVASVIASAQLFDRERGVEQSGTVGALPGVGVHFANAYTIALADSDGPYAELLARPGSAVFTDGVPVAWVGKRAYPSVTRDWDRVHEPDMMTAVLGASGPEAPRHYLLGGSPETLALSRPSLSAGLRPWLLAQRALRSGH